MTITQFSTLSPSYFTSTMHTHQEIYQSKTRKSTRAHIWRNCTHLKNQIIPGQTSGRKGTWTHKAIISAKRESDLAGQIPFNAGSTILASASMSCSCGVAHLTSDCSALGRELNKKTQILLRQSSQKTSKNQPSSAQISHNHLKQAQVMPSKALLCQSK